MPISSASQAQRAIIELPIDTPAIVVKAGPGSGKTRVLCDRIAYLISQGVDPRQISAVTFTQLAAAEFRRRIEEQAEVDVWTGTFHGFAYRILHEHGANWGFPRPIRALDEAGQQHTLRNAFQDVAGWRCDASLAREIAQQFSARKRRGLQIDEMDYAELLLSPYVDIQAVDRAYHERLTEEAVFDYDELIFQVNVHLRNDPVALQSVRQNSRWLLVDEFQDVSDDQYALISIVAPVGHDDRQLFAVGDERQSIYRFRGASSRKLFARLKNEYLAIEVGLNENFRSSISIVTVANLVQPPDGRTTLVSVSAEEDRPIHIYQFQTVDGEAQGIAEIVKRRIAEGDKPESIAVLYSTHRRAEAVESAIRKKDVPLYRHLRNSIHTRPEAEPLIALMRDSAVAVRQHDVLRTLGLRPAGLVDELDWIRWDRERSASRTLETGLGLDHRLATISLCLKRATPPTTPHGVLGFSTRLLNAYGPIVNIVDESEWAKLHDHLEYIDRYLTGALYAVQSAIDANLAVVFLTGDSHDAYLARALFQQVLPEGDRNAGTFYLCLDCDVPNGVRGVTITPVFDPTTTVTVTLQAWRIAQLLLPSEQLEGMSFVALDIETNDKRADRADIIEIGAIRFDPVSGEIIDRFESFVWNNKLTGDITQITGITLHDLYNAPKVGEVLQRFIAWLRPDDIIVGHNVADFDLTVLDRHAIASGLGAIQQPSIDTLTLSRRLLPQQSSKLEDLMASLNFSLRASHRALPDAETTAELFQHLMRERDKHLRVRSLDGALPLVAASLLEYRGGSEGDGALLIELGGRRLRVGAAGGFAARARQILGHQWNALGGNIRSRNKMTSRAEEAWIDFRMVWTELIERHHALMPNLTAAELAGSIALSANHSTGILPGHVTMMTVHSAKGKEWPTVIMIGAEDDQFPSRKDPDAEDLDEGGRLFYVGVTRAQSRLLISWAIERDGLNRARSRFIARIPLNDPTVAISRTYRD